MQELTLTGATLLSNHDGPGSPAVDPLFLHNHTGPTMSSSDDVELTTTTRLPVGAHHRDGAAHDHDHCGCGTAPARPSVQLQVPVTELVAQEPPQIRKALQTILRMGTYELFAEVLQAWQQTNTHTQQHHYNNTTTTLTNQPPAIASTPVSDELVVLNEEGHGLVHWASKRTEDVRFLTLLLEHVANGKDPTLVPNLVTQPTRDATHMTPLHWACTEPHALPVIRRLLNAFTLKTPSYAPERLLEARDSTGCTPLLIAAQYGQVETVAYLIQKGANKAAKDDSHDTATHWAAYKGSPTVLGLLLYYDVRPLTAPDVYGQTPLHLAALRGHASACRYMIHRLPSKDESRRLLTMTDKNGRTAEALAAHKQKDAVVAVLQSCQNRLAPPRQRFRQVLAWKSPSFWMRTLPLACWQCTKTIVSVQAWQSWLGIGSSVADDDSPVLPYYYVLSNYCVNVFFYGAVLLPLGNIEKGLLWDCMTLHIWNVLCFVASFYCLVRTQTTDPGNLNGTGTTQVDIQPLRRLYEVTLEAYAHDDDDGPNHAVAASQVQLCHSCHIARPPRSKHDRFTKTCVLQFDHHCPFVGATIGLYNYKWFYLMLLFMTLYFLGFSIALGMYFVRSLRVPLWQVVLGLYLAAHVFMTAGMWFYHTQLLLGNLTTNEHLNLRKYPYLWETRAYVSGKTKTVYRNPWNISWWHNIQDRFHPSAASYTVPESHETVRQSQALLSTVTSSSSSSSSTATPTPLRHVPTQEAV